MAKDIVIIYVLCIFAKDQVLDKIDILKLTIAQEIIILYLCAMPNIFSRSVGENMLKNIYLKITGKNTSYKNNSDDEKDNIINKFEKINGTWEEYKYIKDIYIYVRKNAVKSQVKCTTFRQKMYK